LNGDTALYCSEVLPSSDVISAPSTASASPMPVLVYPEKSFQ
jgi:hypothetical protein